MKLNFIKFLLSKYWYHAHRVSNHYRIFKTLYKEINTNHLYMKYSIVLLQFVYATFIYL